MPDDTDLDALLEKADAALEAVGAPGELARRPDLVRALGAALGGAFARALGAAAKCEVSLGPFEEARDADAAALAGLLPRNAAGAGPAAGFGLTVTAPGGPAGHAALFLAPAASADLAGRAAGLEPDALAAKKEKAEVTDEDFDALAAVCAPGVRSASEEAAVALGGARLEAASCALVDPGDAAALAELVGEGPFLAASGALTVDGEASAGLLVASLPCLDAMAALLASPASGASAPGPAGAEAAGAGTVSRSLAETLRAVHPNVERVLRLRLPVSVVLAGKTMTVEEIRALGPGAIIEFSKSADEFLDLCVGEKVIGEGEVVIVNERFGLHLRRIASRRERIKSMG